VYFYQKKESKSKIRVTSKQKYLLAVISQLTYGFFDVAQCQVGLLLFIERERRVPSSNQFFDGAHINIPIVKEALQGRHMFLQELTILANGIPTQGRLAFLAKGRKEFKCLLFSTPAVTGRGFDSIQETRFFVVDHTPLLHEQKYLIGLVYRYVWTLSHKFQLIVGYHRCNLKDEVPFRVQTCHF